VGSRSRKRRSEASGNRAQRAPRPRGAEADEIARAKLEPLAPGERPRAVTAAAIVATAAVPLNILAAPLAERTTAAEWRFTILQSIILAVAAYGLWKTRYWAVLGMMVLLALTCVIGFGTILLARNVPQALLGIVLTGLAGTLFWKLVRALARIQMPQRRPSG
jgi:hypothetical protein